MAELGAAAAKATALANGLRKSITTSGRRWRTWPGGSRQLEHVLDRIDAVRQRLAPAAGDAAIAACVADLRALLEWTTYQSASLASARALTNARRARVLARRLGLIDGEVTALRALAEAEAALIESVRTRNGYMQDLAARHAHLALPVPLVNAEALVSRPERPPGRLALIAKLKQQAN